MGKECNHQFGDITNYDRDDLGFYLDCINCKETIIFEAYSESDFYNLFFGGENLDDDYDDEDDFQCCDKCDLPDACADFGCAIKLGVRKEPEW